MKLSQGWCLDDLHDAGKGQQIGSFATGLAAIAEILEFLEGIELTLPDDHPMRVFKAFQQTWVTAGNVRDVFINVHQFCKIQVICGPHSHSKINLSTGAWGRRKMTMCHYVSQLDIEQCNVVLGHPFHELHVVLIVVSHRSISQAEGSLQLLSCSSDVIAFRAAITSGRFLAELLALATHPLDGVGVKILVAELVEQLLSLREDATLHLRCASDVCVACRTHDRAADEVCTASWTHDFLSRDVFPLGFLRRSGVMTSTSSSASGSSAAGRSLFWVGTGSMTTSALPEELAAGAVVGTPSREAGGAFGIALVALDLDQRIMSFSVSRIWTIYALEML